MFSPFSNQFKSKYFVMTFSLIPLIVAHISHFYVNYIHISNVYMQAKVVYLKTHIQTKLSTNMCSSKEDDFKT